MSACIIGHERQRRWQWRMNESFEVKTICLSWNLAMLCESKTVFVNLQIYYKDSADFVTSGEQFRRLKFGDRYFYTHTVSTYFWLYKSCIKYYVYFNNNKVEQFQLVFLRIERLNENVTLVKNYGCKRYWLFCHPTKKYSFLSLLLWRAVTRLFIFSSYLWKLWTQLKILFC